jgi:hypothetical protein
MWKKPNVEKLTRPYRQMAEVLHGQAKMRRKDNELRIKALAEALTGVPLETEPKKEDE